MSKKSTSERLQLKQIKQTHPEEFEHKDHCILFFMNEMKYSVAERKNLVEEDVQLMSTVSVKLSGKKYTATLMFIGSKDECKQRMGALVPVPSVASSPPKSTTGKQKDNSGTIGKDVSNELKKVQKLSVPSAMQIEDCSDDDSDCDGNPQPCPRETESTLKRASSTSTRTSFDDNWRNDVTKQLQHIIAKVSRIEDHILNNKPLRIPNDSYCEVVTTPPNSKKMRLALEDDQGEPSGRSAAAAASPSLMYNETNLLLLPSGGDIKKYALKILANLFTTEEMAGGIVEPSREKATCKVELDPTRVDLLKRAIKEKFGEVQFMKKWPLIRQSLNQKCLDAKRKIPKPETE